MTRCAEDRIALKRATETNRGASQNQGYHLGVPITIIRTIIVQGLDWGPAIYGSYHIHDIDTYPNNAKLCPEIHEAVYGMRLRVLSLVI